MIIIFMVNPCIQATTVYRRTSFNRMVKLVFRQLQCTIGPILIAWFNYCVLSFASESANLLISLASHEARKVYYTCKQNTIAFPIIVNTIETRNLQLIDPRN